MKLTIPFAILLAGSTALAADPPAPSKFLHVTNYQVKPGMHQDFEDLLRNRWMPAMKKGGASPIIYSSSPSGGASGRYVIVSPFDSFAIYDGPSALHRGAGDAAYHRIQAQRNQQIEERSSVTLRRVPEMSVPAGQTKPSPMILLQRVQIAPEKRSEFEALWKSEVVAAVRKAGRYVTVGRVTLGGVTEYHITTGLDSYAELDKGVTAAQLSMTPEQYEDFNKRAAQTNGVIRREVLRRRLDLMGADK